MKKTLAIILFESEEQVFDSSRNKCRHNPLII